MITQAMEGLKQAVTFLDVNAKKSFLQALGSVRKAYSDDDEVKGEILLLEVAGGVVAPADALDTLLQAEKLLGGHSQILTPQTRFAENHFDAFTLWGSELGKADMLRGRCEHIEKITEVFQRLTGFGAGISECILAQIAYYRGDFEEAMHCSTVDIPKGYDGQISLIKVYLLEIQAGVARHTMNQKLWRTCYGRLKEIASGQPNLS